MSNSKARTLADFASQRNEAYKSLQDADSRGTSLCDTLRGDKVAAVTVASGGEVFLWTERGRVFSVSKFTDDDMVAYELSVACG